VSLRAVKYMYLDSGRGKKVNPKVKGDEILLKTLGDEKFQLVYVM